MNCATKLKIVWHTNIVEILYLKVMKYFRIILCVLLHITAHNLSAQESAFVVYDSTGTPHLMVEDGKLFIIRNDSLKAAFVVKGNIIFLDVSAGTPEILFRIKPAKGIVGEAARIVYPKGRKTVLTFFDNTVYWGQDISRNPIIGFYEINEKEQTAFIDAYSGNVLFHFNLKKIPNPLLIAITTYFIQFYQLEINTVEQFPFEHGEYTNDNINIIRIIDDYIDEYVWDGYLLHNVTTRSKLHVWAFDGTNIFRYYFETGDDLIWDGESLSRKWVRYEKYFKQGNALKVTSPRATVHHQFIIHDNVIRPAWNHLPEMPYIEFYSEIPLPLLLALAFRLIP